jgi:hypothetical protein
MRTIEINNTVLSSPPHCHMPANNGRLAFGLVSHGPNKKEELFIGSCELLGDCIEFRGRSIGGA